MERSSVHALLIDDDPGDYQFTRALVRQIEQYEITLDWASSYEEGVDALSNSLYDLFFVDYFLEDRSGLDLLREAQRRGITTPMIMLTGRGSHDVDVEAMRAGAADYLNKGEIDPANVERSIRYALTRSVQYSALIESEAKLRAMFDHLPMGLYRCTPRGQLMEANPALERILMADEGELQEGRDVHFFLNPSDVESFMLKLRQFGVVRGFQSEIERTDGTAVEVRNTARMHRDSSGEVLYIEGALEEVK